MREKLVLGWRKSQTTRAAVKQAIGTLMDKGLPDTYNEELFNQKCELAYLHVFESYQGAGQSIYATLS